MNQNEQSLDIEKMLETICFSNKAVLGLENHPTLSNLPLSERMFRQSGRTTRMLGILIKEKSEAIAVARKVYPGNSSSIVRTLVVFATHNAAEYWKENYLTNEAFKELNIDLVSVDGDAISIARQYIASNPKIAKDFDKDNVKMRDIVFHLPAINAGLRRDGNVEIVLDHEVYEKTYGDVINRYLDFAVSSYSVYK